MYLMDLFQGWESKGLLKLHFYYFFGGGGLFLGDSNAEKWGDHQNKEFFIDYFCDESNSERRSMETVCLCSTNGFELLCL